MLARVRAVGSAGEARGRRAPQHCACCGGGLPRELVPVDRDELSGNNCGCPFPPQPFPGNLPARPVSNATPVCRISTAVCAPLLIRLHNTPCASCPAEGPGGGNETVLEPATGRPGSSRILGPAGETRPSAEVSGPHPCDGAGLWSRRCASLQVSLLSLLLLPSPFGHPWHVGSHGTVAI